MKRPQFSLRTFLAVVTALAVGCAAWYQWPFRVSETLPSPLKPFAHVRTTTWKRKWDGAKYKHGIERSLVGGKVWLTTTFKNGARYGPSASYGIHEEVQGDLPVLVATQAPVLSGSFANDLREGIWIEKTYGATRRSTWHAGYLDGPFDIEQPGGRTDRMQFANGRLTDFDQRPVNPRLRSLLDSGGIDSRTADALRSDALLDFDDKLLKEAVAELATRHRVSIIIDDRTIENPNHSVIANYTGIDFASALALITVPYGLGCDYRYGHLWITTAADADSWSDPTGVSELKIPSGSPAANKWSGEMGVSAKERPLAPVVEAVAEPYAVRFEGLDGAPAESNPMARTITAFFSGNRRDVLGYLLYKGGLYCRLDGETLVIRPRDEP